MGEKFAGRLVHESIRFWRKRIEKGLGVPTYASIVEAAIVPLRDSAGWGVCLGKKSEKVEVGEGRDWSLITGIMSLESPRSAREVS